jgi:adenosylcobinamide kinase/adenosylcobinamide-phosphate guanylyltransferase
MKTLILGGVRSGKSRLAERLATDSGRHITYIATAQPGDEEMRARIRLHQQRRPAHWALIEEPIALARTLMAHDRAEGMLLVECLTLWLNNLLHLDDPHRCKEELAALHEALPTLGGDIVLVSNETGLGVVPLGELSRRFCDEAGWLHQALAQMCDRVIFTVAGLTQVLKDI